ncbi:PREDICTED: CSC1-like protein RXW8 [Ipomoea nil]|uniref:CSC1-like protein RXW8 n=1 Tax=Ipomoea nil TaxID=35883 RepID=UPI000901B14E|nr:PREDICTED: CSC1-like protein RXW8 [Ipomoea nil]XP_019155874.1 PREDICTED: CSC1-like protein RXW8 [Ipomoea nil]
MNLSALLFSAGVNTVVCVVCFSLYSVFRKQPSLVDVYFSQNLSHVRLKRYDPFCRFVPSPSWIVKAWETSDEEITSIGGLDALVFVRTIVFSLRVFSIASIMCIFVVLPLNYFGQEVEHTQFFRAESLDHFTIDNVKEGSEWLWVHCLTLYIITCAACILLYVEFKNITAMRLGYITSCASNPSYFTILVRGIPRSPEESYSDSVTKFFTNYYAPSYLSHQILYRAGSVQKLATDSEKMYMILKSSSMKQHCESRLFRCGLCGISSPFTMLSPDPEIQKGKSGFDSELRKKECGAALVFFKTRYAAFVASQGLQSANPMLWTTDPAPEPEDMYWSNICVPYQHLWIRKIAMHVASVCFVIFFLVPVSLTQGLVHLGKLQKTFPSLRGPLRRRYIVQLVTGYLPSVVLVLFSYLVPPIMMFFSTMECSISRSGRKKSACYKIMYFMIWNVFFAQTISGSVIDGWGAIGHLSENLKDMPTLLATAIPATATFFITYVITSGWVTLATELMQPAGLLYNFVYRTFLKNKDSSYGNVNFPYHTELPRILLLGLLGFTFSILAPLILPALIIYFGLAYFVYRNQILNVYSTQYQTGGLYWLLVHNVTIFSLVLMQLIALTVFGLKESTVASSSTVPLIICTLLFNQYCRQRFHPVFLSNPAQVLVDMDRQDEESGKMKEIHQKVTSAYCQFNGTSFKLGDPVPPNPNVDGEIPGLQPTSEDDIKPAPRPTLRSHHTSFEIEDFEIEELHKPK